MSNRREFIKKSTIGASALVIGGMGFSSKSYASIIGSNDRIKAAVLGVNSRGWKHFEGFMNQPNVEVKTICDPDLNIAKERAKQFKDVFKQEVNIEQDLRVVYEDKDIDVVSIASPNHWHALSVVWACQAGKDVYVEKPASHNIWEGRKMVEAAQKYDRIVQHGVQLRSSKTIKEAMQLLHEGYIGRVYMARGVVFRMRGDIGDHGISPVPEGLDYDLWTGPAQKQPFSRNLVHYNWHWNWNFGNGDIANQGVHETDLCRWGLDVGLPTRISAMGGKFLWNDCKQVPEVLTSVFHYPEEEKIIQFEVRPWYTNTEEGVKVGNIFYGEKGILVVDGYNSYKTYFGENREPGKSGSDGEQQGSGIALGDTGTVDHFTNFIEAVRNRDKSILNAPIETGHLSAGLAHLANISYRVGETLTFNPETERFVDSPKANQMLTRDYRKPFVVPENV